MTRPRPGPPRRTRGSAPVPVPAALAMTARLAAAILAVGLGVYLRPQTKNWVAPRLRTLGPRTVAGGHVRLHYQENTGIAFGRLRGDGRQAGIIAYSVVMSLALGGLLVHRLLRRRRPGLLLPAGLAALLAGTLGNLHDRLERGYVIDFIDF